MDFDIKTFNRSHFSTLKHLDKGGEAVVYKGESDTYGEVCVKIFNAATVTEPSKKEIALLLKHSLHINIVRLLGLYNNQEGSIRQTGYVMEFMPGGSLSSVIHNPKIAYGQRSIFNWILQAGRGLQYLHEAGIVHRDVKPQNMLLDEYHKVLKVSDFGMARTLDQTMLTFNGGTVSYMAPELFEADSSTLRSAVSTANDVYALGITIWEIFHRKIPFSGEGVFTVTSNVPRGKRPPLGENLQPGIKNLITKSWCNDAKERVTILQIISLAKKVLEAKPDSSLNPAPQASPVSYRPTVPAHAAMEPKVQKSQSVGAAPTVSVSSTYTGPETASTHKMPSVPSVGALSCATDSGYGTSTTSMTSQMESCSLDKYDDDYLIFINDDVKSHLFMTPQKMFPHVMKALRAFIQLYAKEVNSYRGKPVSRFLCFNNNFQIIRDFTADVFQYCSMNIYKDITKNLFGLYYWMPQKNLKVRLQEQLEALNELEEEYKLKADLIQFVMTEEKRQITMYCMFNSSPSFGDKLEEYREKNNLMKFDKTNVSFWDHYEKEPLSKLINEVDVELFRNSIIIFVEHNLNEGFGPEWNDFFKNRSVCVVVVYDQNSEWYDLFEKVETRPDSAWINRDADGERLYELFYSSKVQYYTFLRERIRIVAANCDNLDVKEKKLQFKEGDMITYLDNSSGMTYGKHEGRLGVVHTFQLDI